MQSQKNTGYEIARHLIHEMANFLNLIYLKEIDIDTERLKRTIDFANAVYNNSQCAQLIKSQSIYARGLCAVIWRLKEKNLPYQISSDEVISCDTSAFDLNFPPIRFLEEQGWEFTVTPGSVSVFLSA